MNKFKPNFFIIGGPKCGTTALSEYLRSNPQVFFCEPKEPHYFNDDYRDRGITSEHEYLELFNNVQSHHKAIGEGSVQYLNSETAVKNILEFNPNAKFIVMLRNPVEVAYSYHAECIISHGENILDFASAWNLRHERRKGESLPPNAKENKIFVYADIARFGTQLEKLISLVDKKNIKIIFFDDFRDNTLDVYKDTLMFLNVTYDGKIDFPKINQSKKYRSTFFENLRKEIIKLKNKYNLTFRTGILSYLRKKNVKIAPRKELDETFKIELKEYYLNEINTIERITGRNLAHWK